MGIERRTATAAEAKAMAHPLRLRILRLCLDEERTNRELADRLGKDPGTVLHHVRMLVDNGFLVAGEPRRGRRNSRERPYIATRKSWVLDFSGDGDVDAGIEVAVAEAFAAELREAGLAAVLENTRFAVRLRPSDRDEFLQRLRGLTDEMIDRDDPAGEPLSVYLAVHRRDVPPTQETKETA